MNVRGNLRRLYNGVNKHIARHLIPRLLRPRSPVPIARLGTFHGAWNVPKDLIRQDMICYCVGVGMEASLDVALAEAGARVWSFDPTPTAIKYMESLDYPRERLQFLPIGVWNTNTEMTFFMPADGVVNLSIKDVHRTGEGVVAKCKTLKTIMAELGHDRIDFLKVDVEGSWGEIIENMVADRVPVDVFCVEFDSPTSTAKVLHHASLLRSAGYELLDIDRDNYLFVHRDSPTLRVS